jgi:hypothetical protein
MEVKYNYCTSDRHHRKSQYPADETPYQLFLKDPDDPKSKCLKTCLDCRKSKRINNGKRKQKIKEKNNNIEQGYSFCNSAHHDRLSPDIPRNKVPLESFLKDPNNPMSQKYISCALCRKYETNLTHTRTSTNKIKAEQEGKRYCLACHTFKDILEMATNQDKSESPCCIKCKDAEKERGIKLRKLYNEIKYEFIEKEQCSCQRCKKIYLVPKVGKFHSETFETYVKNGQRYLIYEKEVSVRDFLKTNKNLVELRLIQLDHLTEDEQRERGFLLPEDKYIPKKDSVSRMSSEKTMRQESKKCQHLCAKCHLIITIERRNEVRSAIGNLQKVKKEYIKDEKLKCGGCALCGFFDEELLEFLEFDHFDRDEKLYTIAGMITDNNVSLEDVKTERQICRILCKHCHIIWTHEQREYTNYNGSFSSVDILL